VSGRDERDPHDDALRQAFSELRRQDAAGAPDFYGVVARTPPARRPGRALLGRALAAAALAVALAAGLLARRPRPEPALPSIAAWTAPTDFLLRTPGGEVLSGVPRIGSGRPLVTLDGADGAPDSRERTASP